MPSSSHWCYLVLSMLYSTVQAASSQVDSGAQLTSCTAWRQGAVAQAIQIPKQTPEGSCRGLLDSPEHTDSSQLASLMPLLLLAGPGDVALQPRLFWIPKQRSEGSCQRPQDWNLSSMLEQAMCSQSASRCTPGLLHFLETECSGPGCSDPEADT